MRRRFSVRPAAYNATNAARHNARKDALKCYDGKEERDDVHNGSIRLLENTGVSLHPQSRVKMRAIRPCIHILIQSASISWM